MSRVFEHCGAWWIDFKDARGIRRRKKIGPSKRIAQEVLDGYLGKVAQRLHLGVIEDSPISFADFAKDWQARVAPTLKPRSQERWFGIVELWLKPAFQGTLRAINNAHVEAYIARRLKRTACNRCDGKKAVPTGVACSKCHGSGEVPGAAPSTVNRELTVLKHMMKRAVLWEYLGRNPVEDVRPLREAPGRTRFLSDEEIDRLLTECVSAEAQSSLVLHYLKPFVIVALNTGMRRNEILYLRRRDIDWTNRMITLGNTKNGEARHVFLNDTAFDALKSLPARIDSDRFFPFGPNQVSMAFRRAVKRAEIEDFRLHDLRHTFASYQAMSGVQARGLQELLGHKDNRMTMRYSHLADPYLKAAVNGVNLGAEKRTPSLFKKDGTYLAPAAGQIEKA